MIKEVYRFYAKKNHIIMSINTTKHNGSIEIVPAYDPNRNMSGPVQSGTKIYNYDAKKIFSLKPLEAAKLLSDYKELSQNPQTKCKSIIHDRSKVQGINENMLTYMTAGKWKEAYTITISYKIGNNNEYESYLFHGTEEFEIFKGYLRFVAFMLSPISVVVDSFFEEIHGYGYKDKKKNNNYNNYNQNNGGQNNYRNNNGGY